MLSRFGYDELKLMMKFLFRAGDELPADAKVIESKGLELNEYGWLAICVDWEKGRRCRVGGDDGFGWWRYGASNCGWWRHKSWRLNVLERKLKPELTPSVIAIWRNLLLEFTAQLFLSPFITIVHYFFMIMSSRHLKNHNFGSGYSCAGRFICRRVRCFWRSGPHWWLAQAKVLPQNCRYQLSGAFEFAGCR